MWQDDDQDGKADDHVLHVDDEVATDKTLVLQKTVLFVLRLQLLNGLLYASKTEQVHDTYVNVDATHR